MTLFVAIIGSSDHLEVLFATGDSSGLNTDHIMLLCCCYPDLLSEDVRARWREAESQVFNSPAASEISMLFTNTYRDTYLREC